jgi:hypothetical protein
VAEDITPYIQDFKIVGHKHANVKKVFFEFKKVAYIEI